MRRGANRTLLASNLYDVYSRLEIDGVDIADTVGHEALVSATWTAAIDQLATQGQVNVFLGTGTGSSSLYGSNPFTEYLPKAGRYFQLYTSTVAKGDAPSTYDIVFNGRIDGADMAGQPSAVVMTCRDMMALLLNRIVEPDEPPETPDGKNGFLAPSDELISWLNATFRTVYPAFGDSFIEQRLSNTPIIGAGLVEWVVNDKWIQYGQNLAEVLAQETQQSGWNFHYRIGTLPNTIGVFMAYDPDRSSVVSAQYTVQPSEVVRILKCTINDQDVRNVWDLVWNSGASRTRSRTLDPASIGAYQRRYAKFPADANINTSERASAMLAGMISDTKDPIVELDYERLYFWPVELGDKHFMLANGIHTAIALDLSVVGYTHTISAKSMRTVVRCRGTAISAAKRWRRGVEGKVFVNLVGDTTAGIMPEGSLVLDVDDLTPAG